MAPAHVLRSIGWGRRFRTLLAWTYANVTYGHGARVITGADTQTAALTEAAFHSAEDTPLHLAR